MTPLVGPLDPFKGVVLDIGDYTPNKGVIWLFLFFFQLFFSFWLLTVKGLHLVRLSKYGIIVNDGIYLVAKIEKGTFSFPHVLNEYIL